MNVALLTRYPRVDTMSWKRDLAARVLDAGQRLTVVYTRSAFVDQVQAGFREFGFGVGRRYAEARRRPSSEAGVAKTLSAWCADRGVEVLGFRRVADPQLAAALAARRVDVLLLAGADIVPKGVLEVPAIATLNAHFGLLPRYRGMNVAEWSIYHDDPVGVSVHVVDAGIDTGDIVSTRPLLVERGDTLESIRVRQRQAAVELLADATAAAGAGSLPRRAQEPEAGRQYYRMHPRLRALVEAKLSSGEYGWLGRIP